MIKNILKNLSWFAKENISSSGIELLKSSKGFDNSKNIKYGMLDKYERTWYWKSPIILN